MIIQIQPIKIKEDSRNEVTSAKVFRDRKIMDENGEFLFNDEGIFSEKIFGKFGSCKCGKTKKTNRICPECGCRVLSKKHIPDFYIKFDFDLPNRFIDYGTYNKNVIESLLYYKGFLYDGVFIEFNLKDMDLTKYPDKSKIKIGKEAILSLGVSEDWYNHNVHRLISIPHTSYRQITHTKKDYFLGDLNTIYIDMIKNNLKYKEYCKNNTITLYNELNIKYVVCAKLEDLYKNLFGILSKNHKNIIDRELRGQPETGMVRAVMTNNFSLDEDTLVIGKYFIPTLYPYLYNKYSDELGNIDVAGLNKELIDEEYLVLFNRQPTIGAKSIIAMKPIFSDKDAEQFVIQANPIVYDGLAADVDGDSLNVIALYTKEACEEAKKLLASNNYIEGSNMSIRNGLLEEFNYIKENTIDG